jgi:uncharacterized protein YegP (UPF0339 family)
VKIVVKPTANRGGQWYYVEVADNGEVIGTSEMYSHKGNALRAARQKAGAFSDIVPVEVENDGRQGA